MVLQQSARCMRLPRPTAHHGAGQCSRPSAPVLSVPLSQRDARSLELLLANQGTAESIRRRRQLTDLRIARLWKACPAGPWAPRAWASVAYPPRGLPVQFDASKEGLTYAVRVVTFLAVPPGRKVQQDVDAVALVRPGIQGGVMMVHGGVMMVQGGVMMVQG